MTRRLVCFAPVVLVFACRNVNAADAAPTVIEQKEEKSKWGVGEYEGLRKGAWVEYEELWDTRWARTIRDKPGVDPHGPGVKAIRHVRVVRVGDQYCELLETRIVEEGGRKQTVRLLRKIDFTKTGGAGVPEVRPRPSAPTTLKVAGNDLECETTDLGDGAFVHKVYRSKDVPLGGLVLRTVDGTAMERLLGFGRGE